MPVYDTITGKIIMKFKKLSTAIEMTNCSMDDPDYRWVEHKIEEYENQDKIPHKQELIHANELWRIYNV
tara:strand:+ start:327 stop:533 length:207 start_codon:yes stop_codon:yes gene_type:complete